MSLYFSVHESSVTCRRDRGRKTIPPWWPRRSSSRSSRCLATSPRGYRGRPCDSHSRRNGRSSSTEKFFLSMSSVAAQRVIQRDQRQDAHFESDHQVIGQLGVQACERALHTCRNVKRDIFIYLRMQRTVHACTYHYKKIDQHIFVQKYILTRNRSQFRSRRTSDIAEKKLR